MKREGRMNDPKNYVAVGDVKSDSCAFSHGPYFGSFPFTIINFWYVNIGLKVRHVHPIYTIRPNILPNISISCSRIMSRLKRATNSPKNDIRCQKVQNVHPIYIVHNWGQTFGRYTLLSTVLELWVNFEAFVLNELKMNLVCPRSNYSIPLHIHLFSWPNFGRFALR